MGTLDQIKAVKIKGFLARDILLTTDISDKQAHGLDSMGRVELVLALEEKFQIQLPDEELDGIKTFGDLVKVIENKVGVH